jgi:AcrR family transcriptional regulator
MVTNKIVNRNRGRPRQFQDRDVFAAMNEVLAELGLHNLTLGSVAARLGCTSQALIRRFGSRQGLILGYLVWGTDESAGRYERLQAEYASPLEAFRAGYVSPGAPFGQERPGPSGYANLLVFGIEAELDPVLHEELDRRERIYHQNLAESVRAAIQAGELSECDADDIAFLLLAAGSGAMLRWIANPVAPPHEQIARVFDAVIGPYRIEAAANESALQ